MKAINSPPKPLPSEKDLTKIFKEFISTKPQSEQFFSLDYKALELNGGKFYIAYNEKDKSAVGYINIFLKTIASANEEQKSRQMQKLFEDKKFAVAQLDENLKLTKLSYHTEVFDIINSGDFDDAYDLSGGIVSKGYKSTSKEAFELKFLIRNKRYCYQQTFVCEDEKMILTGTHKYVNKDEKFHLTDGAIKIENNRFNTNITVKNGKLTSLECYQSEKNGHSFHVDFEKKEFFCKIYQNGEFIKIDLNFSEPQKIYNAIYNAKDIQSFALDTVDISKINTLIKGISQNIEVQSDKLFEPKLTTNQGEHDDRDINKLVEYINGTNSPKTKPLKNEKSVKQSPSTPAVTSGDSEETHDSDEVIYNWILQCESERKQKPQTTFPTKTLTISELKKRGAEMLMAALPELKSVKTEFKISDSSSSAECVALPIGDSTTPSATPNLPKASDFYKTWENYFLTEVLQAIANILNEDRPDFIISDDKKNKSYELLHSLMTSMSFPDLCEGLALTEEKQAILLQKLLTKSQANFSPEMAQFAARKSMNRAYEEWLNGRALQQQAKDMQI